ncbi:MAG: DNA-3-methyladenine glycosylase I, partial [Actinobacteria bacterium]|nr:DNA-3-methyladenine glycosylase I [Actinomycetota bacterium]
MEDGLVVGSDGRRRCGWCIATDAYIAYHDHEWGQPVTDDVALFEKICLEGFQSGLSWLTILRKRDNFRTAFDGFDPSVVASYGSDDVERLLADPGIVRHRGKIDATVANAAAVLAVQERCGSLAALVWSFEPPRRGRPIPTTVRDIPSRTESSTALAEELKRF